MKNTLVLAFLLSAFAAQAQYLPGDPIADKAEAIEQKVIGWRHHIHQNPELSNREFKTAEYVADHLRSLGIETRTGVAHTGVVGILKGGKPGPVIA
ncbi:MAG TPA: amidohydrolase, partial [Flavilitoribacter sp.]|nr:amidohydrolase [Flavilitoribacter sp.]